LGIFFQAIQGYAIFFTLNQSQVFAISASVLLAAVTLSDANADAENVKSMQLPNTDASSLLSFFISPDSSLYMKCSSFDPIGIKAI